MSELSIYYLPASTDPSSNIANDSSATVSDVSTAIKNNANFMDTNSIVQKGFLRSGNFVTGSLGWNIDAAGNAEFNNGTFRGILTASSINIPDSVTANSFHVDSNGNAWWGATTLGGATAKVLNTGAGTFSSMTITGGAISGTSLAGIPNSTATDISLLEFTHSLTFSVASANKINWTSGTITMSNGRTFAINSGNTGAMAALTYIYLDTGVSTTVLQTTTTFSTAMGANKLVLGTAQNNTVTAMFIPFGVGTPLIDGSNIGALSIVAGNIAASTITAAKLTVAQLSAITADMGAITAGTITVVGGGNTVSFTPASATVITSGPTGSPTFTVTAAGAMTSTSGSIAAFAIAGTTLSATNLVLTSGAANTANIAVGTGSTLAGMNSGNSGSDISFWAGDTFANRATAPFRVDLSGNLTATSATITQPKFVAVTIFESSSRFTLNGANNPTFGTLGLHLNASAAAPSTSNASWTVVGSSAELFTGSPQFSVSSVLFDTSKPGMLYYGLGLAFQGTASTDVTVHIGFKIIITGGVISVYGTQADGGTENVTAALTTLANTDSLDLVLIVNGSTSVNYYWRKNGGALSAATTLTGNVPTSGAFQTFFIANNLNNANTITNNVGGSSYQR